jgi:hypothetical protein
MYGAEKLMDIDKDISGWHATFSLGYSHNGEIRHEGNGPFRLDVDAAPYLVPPAQLRLFD